MTGTEKDFESVLAEAAWHCQDPNHDDDFTDSDGYRNAISEVTETRLRSINPALADRYSDEYQPSAGGHLVWLRESPGRIEVVESGTDDGLRSGTDLVNRAYDQAKAASGA
mgnify:CR=1 FL=1